ncbi:MAG: winged helix-turn-helix transcriptional regulator [Alphaproteobacteria bacterium]|jgi:DNA-binding MarR family transcriptional regulator|nr:winged helix-turn-helix transcriptional regulator [Alphaproteobacteria bacterium]MBT5389756.1 winged helix-turn-helix transcriptional regulator [Alphaproteobacteria bacterium]MBT5655085.1 winged helix-turn-helix transcriptional regulator [Alphaproteobacteria bacterium]
MATFRNSKDAVECEVMVRLMSTIEGEPEISQRSLAAELGIAVGLVNIYLKRLIHKGYVRVSQVPARRFAYFVTSQGLVEKSQMISDYLSNSLTFFRNARSQCDQLAQLCEEAGWKKIALLGEGEIAEVMQLVSHQFSYDLSIVEISELAGTQFDCVIVTDIISPQKIFDSLKAQWPEERILTLPLSHISRKVLSRKEKAA